ncbi:MAG: HAMP domain-containing protein [Calditrichaeota bacterium]|nr:MAG: HAMP domain-containing protein [Calditrichota bacterium]MBL1205334.1 HAMP domain-containing protein [Calditrichota bacterium]NOG45163.1 HAMP domain-containing protein [Calditrichota bacterium]
MPRLKFKDLKIKTKQTLGFGTILFILIAVNLHSIYNMRELRRELEISSSNSLPRAIAIADINYYSSNLRIAQLQLSFAKTDIQKEEHNKKISKLIDDINQSKDTYESLISESKKLKLYSKKEQELYVDFDSLWDEYLGFSLNCVLLFRENKTEQAITLLNGDAKNIFDAYSSILTEMVRLYDQYLLESVARATETFLRARKFTITLLAATIIISLIMAIAIVRLITVPVSRLESAALAVGEGDLWVNVKYRSKDELGTLATAFNRMIKSLREAQEKAEEKSAKLELQWEVLRETHDELQEKSVLLEQQKQETEQKNADLENTLDRLKEAQNQLVQSEKMASVGQLTAGIAHEINNPINFVSANIKPLKRDVADIIDVLKKYEQAVTTSCLDSNFEEVDKLKKEIDFNYVLEEIDKLLDGIEEGARRTTEIVKGLRNFSRLDEDEQKLSDIQQGLESTLMVLHNELKNKVQIKTEYGNLPQILCYPGKLNQVFLNILQNANQAINESGVITIKTWMDKSWVYISIKDDGNGMSEDVLKRVFEPFYTTKDVGKGTGLGLSISYGIIHDHDGDIEVLSKPGKGSDFIIKLPYKY